MSNNMRKYGGDKLVGIICNSCGDSVDVTEDEHGFDAEPFREFDLVYGYGSELYDFSGVRFDLCEYCVEEFVGRFAIPAESRDYRIKQGYNIEGKPFIYYGFDSDEDATQEQMDEAYERFMDGNKEGE